MNHHHHQSSLLIRFHLFLGFFFSVKAQITTEDDSSGAFQPSLGVVLGILSVMFSVTFILLVYAKLCYRRASAAHENNAQNQTREISSSSRFSGIDKTVIESLPFFRFSALKGSKEGLECSVCLSKFEEIELLRLLPKCKHAFHIDCVDRWLEKHSSCPLCRQKVAADDLAQLHYSDSMRFLTSNRRSELQDESNNIELIVQREESNRVSSRFSVGSSFRKVLKINKDEEDQVPIRKEDEGDDQKKKKILHKHNHKIIVSDFELKNRWSNVSSSDLMFLNTEMLGARSSSRFSSFRLESNQIPSTIDAADKDDQQVMKIKKEIEMKKLFESKINNTVGKNSTPSSSIPPSEDFGVNSSQKARITSPAERRTVSEITAIPRFRDSSMNSETSSSSTTRQTWYPIARTTVAWFANRERRFQHFDQKIEKQFEEV